MEKPKKKMHTILLGTIIVLIIIFINSGIFGIGGEKEKNKGTRQEYAALEQVLMKMEGVGEVTIYFHYEDGEQESSLSDYLALSNTPTKKANRLQGILVIAEGADDLRIRNELSKTLSAVLQIPEHRIVIAEMKKRGNIDESK